MNIRNAQLQDLEKIMFIENISFSKEEAASQSSMQERIENISDTFLVAIDDKEEVLGYIVGPLSRDRYINDELFDEVIPNDKSLPVQTILSLATSPDSRGLGIATILLQELAKIAKINGQKLISLTCLEKLKPFYSSHGYKDEGISSSTHGGEVWYNMTLDLNIS